MKKGLTFLLITALLLLAPGTAATGNCECDFVDTLGHWAETEIKMACEKGLLTGIGESQAGEKIYSPEGLVTRAQLGVWLTKTFALDYGQLRFIKAPVAGDYFWDVENDAWYAEAVILCAVNEIFVAGQQLHPEESVSRIETARAIARAFEAKRINVPMIMLMPTFDDMRGLSREDINAIVFVNNTGIMQGEENLFRPFATLTRAELARIANRCYTLVTMNPVPAVPAEFLLQVGMEEIKSETEFLETDVHIPVVSGMQNVTAQKGINARFRQAVEELSAELNSGAVEHQQNAEAMGFPFHRYALYTRSGPYFENGKILSMYVDYYYYSGGAHGLTDRRMYNYDVASGKVISLSDLFVPDYEYKSLIDETIRAEISRRPDEFFPAEIGFQGISDQQNFYLQNDSLIIYFNQYEIAPYAAGIQEFRIPLQGFYLGLNPQLRLNVQ